MPLIPLIIIPVAVVVLLLVMIIPKIPRRDRRDEKLSYIRGAINDMIKHGWSILVKEQDGENITGIITKRPPHGEMTEDGRRDIAWLAPLDGSREKKIYLDTDPEAGEIIPLAVVDGDAVVSASLKDNEDGAVKAKDISWKIKVLKMTPYEAERLMRSRSEANALHHELEISELDRDKILDRNDNYRNKLEVLGRHNKTIQDDLFNSREEIDSLTKARDTLKLQAEEGMIFRRILGDIYAKYGTPDMREFMMRLSFPGMREFADEMEAKRKKRQEEVGATPAVVK